MKGGGAEIGPVEQIEGVHTHRVVAGCGDTEVAIEKQGAVAEAVKAQKIASAARIEAEDDAAAALEIKTA